MAEGSTERAKPKRTTGPESAALQRNKKERTRKADIVPDKVEAGLLQEDEGSKDTLQHKRALLDRVRHLRRSNSFQALARMMQDPELRREYDMVLSRRREILALQKQGPAREHHRDLAPSMIALMMGKRTRRLLNMVIDESVSSRGEQLRQAIGNDPDNYVPEVVVGAGIYGAIYNVNRQMVMPDDPALTLEAAPRVGGQFGLVEMPLYETNSRTRPVIPGEPTIPGRPNTLNLLSRWAVTSPADTSNRSYVFQNDFADHARLAMFLSGETVPNAQVTRILRTPDGLGKYAVEFLDPRTGDEYEVNTDRVVFTTGKSRELTGLNEKDSQTKQILDEEKVGYGEDKDAKVMSFGEATRRLGDPENPFPLKGFKNVVLSGSQDGGNVLVEIFLGYAAQLAMSSTQLDFLESVVWIGQDAPSKEQFLESCRARYARVGLEFPRDTFEGYFSRIKPRPGRASKLERTKDGGIRVIAFDKGKRRTFDGDHFIYAHGSIDETNDLVRGIFEDKGSKVETVPFIVPGENNGMPVGVQFVGEDIIKLGPPADLRVTDDEIASIPVLKTIPANSVAIFRLQQQAASAARFLAMEDMRNGTTDARIFEDADKLTGQKPAGKRVKRRTTFELGSERPDGVRLPYDMSPSDILRLGFGTALMSEDIDWKALKGKREINLTLTPVDRKSSAGDADIAFDFVSDTPLPQSLILRLEDACYGYAAIALERITGEPLGSRSRRGMTITLPLLEDGVDVSKIRYEVGR